MKILTGPAAFIILGLFVLEPINAQVPSKLIEEIISSDTAAAESIKHIDTIYGETLKSGGRDGPEGTIVYPVKVNFWWLGKQASPLDLRQWKSGSNKYYFYQDEFKEWRFKLKGSSELKEVGEIPKDIQTENAIYLAEYQNGLQILETIKKLVDEDNVRPFGELLKTQPKARVLAVPYLEEELATARTDLQRGQGDAAKTEIIRKFLVLCTLDRARSEYSFMEGKSKDEENYFSAAQAKTLAKD